MKNVALVTGRADPLSGYYFQSLSELGCVPKCVVVDRKEWSAKDQAVFMRRTEGRLAPLSAESCGIVSNVIVVDSHNSDEAIRAIQAHECGVVINGGTPRILRTQFLSSFEAVVNCHPGILPEYRGCTCVEWAVFNNDPVGNTVHLMTPGIDEGPIVCSEAVALSVSDDYVATRVKVFRHGFDLLATAAVRIARGDVSISALPAQEEGTYWAPIDDRKLLIVMDKLSRGVYRYQS